MEYILISSYRIRITSADISLLVARITDAGITMKNIEYIDELHTEITVRRKDLPKIKALTERLGAEISIIRVYGPEAILNLVKYRIVLVCGVLSLILLTVFLPTRVLFISVEGNFAVDDTRIMDAAEKCGVFFGASRKDMRSEQVKNGILQLVPELKWVGVNTKGCCAVISVKERDSSVQDDHAYGTAVSIYAQRDGIISSITVTGGTQLCEPGQAVKENQLLVSGYSDRGLVTVAERADAEIMAITQRQIDAVQPNPTGVRAKIIDRSTKWSLQIGKKQIKLYIGSGNIDSVCGKIRKEIYLALPGGFQMPVCFIKETSFHYEQAIAAQEQQSFESLAREYISADMVGGQILGGSCSITPAEGGYILEGSYTCLESIGKLQHEEIR